PQFPLTLPDRAAADYLLKEAGVGDDSYVVIHAGSAQTVLAEAKRWPADCYAKLVETIRDRTGRRVLIVEGPDEAGVSDNIAGQLSNRTGIHTAVLRGTLGAAAAVLERAAFYAGTDSGLAHLAAAVGKRPITLFAPADPDRVCPHGHRDLVVQPPGIVTPSFLYPYESTKPKMRESEFSITQITVEQVMEKVMRLSEEVG
ncbi:MAG TPA: glycosyltransferase family 9 protein, partial [Tepidisphaeraceae bacterium]